MKKIGTHLMKYINKGENEEEKQIENNVEKLNDNIKEEINDNNDIKEDNIDKENENNIIEDNLDKNKENENQKENLNIESNINNINYYNIS